MTADESTTYFTYADGRRSHITRTGTNVVVVQAGRVISDLTHPDLPTARAEYANWCCDRTADTPAAGDQIVVTNLRDGHVTLVVTDTDTTDTTHQLYSIRGRLVGAGGKPGEPVAVSVSRGEFHFVSRPAPVSVSVSTAVMPAHPVSRPAPVSVSVSTAVMPAHPVSRPAPVSVSSVVVSNRSVSTAGAAPVPCPPRFRPVTWSDQLTRQGRRVTVRPPARRPLSTTKRYDRVEYAVRFEAGPGDWRVAREGHWAFTEVTQATLDGFVAHLAATCRRDAEQIRVTATFLAGDGTCLLAAASAEPVRRRQRAARDRYEDGLLARSAARTRVAAGR